MSTVKFMIYALSTAAGVSAFQILPRASVARPVRTASVAAGIFEDGSSPIPSGKRPMHRADLNDLMGEVYGEDAVKPKKQGVMMSHGGKEPMTMRGGGSSGGDTYAEGATYVDGKIVLSFLTFQVIIRGDKQRNFLIRISNPHRCSICTLFLCDTSYE